MRLSSIGEQESSGGTTCSGQNDIIAIVTLRNGVQARFSAVFESMLARIAWELTKFDEVGGCWQRKPKAEWLAITLGDGEPVQVEGNHTI